MGVPRVSELAGWLGRPFGERGIWSYSCEETRNEMGGEYEYSRSRVYTEG